MQKSVSTGRTTDRPAKLTEEEWRLLARIRQGDRSAFEALYRAYHGRLVRFLANMIRGAPAIDDVISETMLAVWTGADRFRGDSKLSTWIFGIAYRNAARSLRRRPEEDLSAVPDRADETEPPPGSAMAQRQTARLLRSALTQLSPEQRTVVDLTYFHDLSYREIADVMDCPVDTVKTRMFHARRRLRALLTGELSDWI